MNKFDNSHPENHHFSYFPFGRRTSDVIISVGVTVNITINVALWAGTWAVLEHRLVKLETSLDFVKQELVKLEEIKSKD